MTLGEDSEEYQILTDITCINPEVNHPQAPVLAPLRPLISGTPSLLARDCLPGKTVSTAINGLLGLSLVVVLAAVRREGRVEIFYSAKSGC